MGRMHIIYSLHTVVSKSQCGVTYSITILCAVTWQGHRTIAGVKGPKVYVAMATKLPVQMQKATVRWDKTDHLFVAHFFNHTD